MEKKILTSEQIIAYRIGQGLFCPDCYEMGAIRLKGVQDPANPKVKFPSKPVTADDISIFICEECKTIGGRSAGEVKIQEQKSLFDLMDTVDHCARKISFVAEFINQPAPGELDISERGRTGLGLFLREIEDVLDRITDRIKIIMKEERHSQKNLYRKN